MGLVNHYYNYRKLEEDPTRRAATTCFPTAMWVRC